MTPTIHTPTTTTSHDRNRKRDHPGRVWTALAVGVLLALTLWLATTALTASAGSGVVVAQDENNTSLNDTAPYYANETPLGNQSSWYPDGSNVSLDVLGQLSSRLGTYVIGTGEQIPGGTTYAGTIITALLMAGIFLGAVTLTSIGSSGGIVVAATVGYGLTSVGLAPPWFKIVLIMLIGSIAAIAALRATN